jgi:hypothetical protein
MTEVSDLKKENRKLRTLLAQALELLEKSRSALAARAPRTAPKKAAKKRATPARAKAAGRA